MGFWSNIKNRVGRKRHEPQRDTQIYPRLMQVLGGQATQKRQPVYKPTPWNLRAFARTPYARRAINAIKGPIARLDWEVVPKNGVETNSEIERQCEIVTRCLRSPNHDDSWRSLAERVIEDILSGAGAIEMQVSGDKNRPLWLYPVDGLSIQLYPMWSGEPNEPKYNQIPGYGIATAGGAYGIDIRADELIYIAPNPNTSHPFGTGALEVAFTSISRMIGVGDFAANLASNARPNILLQAIGGDQSRLDSIRAYWTNEVEGQGKMPIFGTAKDGELKVLNLTAEGDKALYLAWQEFLKSEIATAFDLSPQNLGVERDVNRNCYSEDTETLTPEGWKSLDELSEDSLVASYNPLTRAVEFKTPDFLHVAEYTGDMIHISGRMTDALVTPDHRMWVRKLGRGEDSKIAASNYQVIAASALESGRFATVASFAPEVKNTRIEIFTLQGCECNGGVRESYPSREILMDDWLAFLGFFAAEGHAGRYGKGTWKVNLCQKDGTAICQEMDALLSRLPFEFAINVSNDGVRRWQVADKALCRWLLMNCGIGSKAKRVPSFVFGLPPTQMLKFYDAAMKGDGTKAKEVGRKSGAYYTACRRLRDDMQLLATYLGHRAVATEMSKPQNGVYRVLVTENTSENEIKGSRNVRRVAYSGRVYCFSVPPHHLFVTRRNGKIAVHGNTSEVAEDRDWNSAILPAADLLSSHINRDAIEGKLGFSQIEFRFVGLDREDEEATSKILDRFYKINVFTPNQILAKLGEPEADNAWADLTFADTQIALSAARGAAQVDDADLTGTSKLKPKQKPKKGR